MSAIHGDVKLFSYKFAKLAPNVSLETIQRKSQRFYLDPGEPVHVCFSKKPEGYHVIESFSRGVVKYSQRIQGSESAMKLWSNGWRNSEIAIPTETSDIITITNVGDCIEIDMGVSLTRIRTGLPIDIRAFVWISENRESLLIRDKITVRCLYLRNLTPEQQLNRFCRALGHAVHTDLQTIDVSKFSSYMDKRVLTALKELGLQPRRAESADESDRSLSGGTVHSWVRSNTEAMEDGNVMRFELEASLGGVASVLGLSGGRESSTNGGFERYFPLTT